MASNENISNRIRTLRTDRNLSQQQLADLLYVTRATVANWESGNRVPDINTLLRLSKVLNVGIYALIDELEDHDDPVTVILVEDEPVILSGFLHILEETIPNIQVFGFQTGREAVEFARANRIDAAFLDIELCGESGIETANTLTEIYPRINIIFLTGHSEYTRDALEMHCSGYIMKPLTPEKIREEIRHLRFPVRGLSV